VASRALHNHPCENLQSYDGRIVFIFSAESVKEKITCKSGNIGENARNIYDSIRNVSPAEVVTDLTPIWASIQATA
jgi:hypothetical protein